MKNYLLTLIGGAALVATSCATTKSYQVFPKSGTETQGRAVFTEEKGKVTLDLNVYKLTPGLHAVHIHEKGDCSSTDASSAGGHWNPTTHNHGKWGHGEHHMGDIGNLNADKDGSARLIFSTDKWCLGCTDETKNGEVTYWFMISSRFVFVFLSTFKFTLTG